MADSEQRVAPAATTPPEPQSVGQALKQARITRDLSLEQVSTELRIEVVQLDALEQDRFDRIGVPVFVKGYIRQYGTRLGLNVNDLLAQYYKQNSLREIEIQPSKTIKLRDERQITVWVIAVVVLLALVVTFAVWFWNGNRFGFGGSPAATPTSVAPAPTAPAAATSSQPAASEATAVTATAAGLPVSTPAGGAPSESPAAQLTTTPAAVSAAEPAPAADEARAPAVTAALEVTFEQDSWAEITDARGERVFYAIGAAGRVAKLTGAPPFAVVLGNAAGVKIVVDGEDFAVPTDGKAGDYARFSVDVAGD